MTDAQLLVATIWPLFLIAVLATVYALQVIQDRLEQIVQRPLEKIEQRLFAIDASLQESNRHLMRSFSRSSVLLLPWARMLAVAFMCLCSSTLAVGVAGLLKRTCLEAPDLRR